MLIRIVKMTFRPGTAEAFRDMMESYSHRIRAMEGCTHLQVLQDIDDPNIVFSYSYWKDEDALENYRRSDLFAEVWPKAKANFGDRPEAWSVRSIIDRP